MRTHKNKIYNCKVIDYNDDIIHDVDYYTLLEVAADLGLSKDSIYNISCRKNNLNVFLSNFKYGVRIYVEKINLKFESK